MNDPTPQMPDPVVYLPVTEVTVLEDRALVVRRGRVRLQPGTRRLRIDGVAPVLIDKTLVAQLSDPDGREVPETTRVRDVDVRRWRVTEDQDQPAALAEITDQIRQTVARRDAQTRRLERIDHELRSLADVFKIEAREIGQDVGWDKPDPMRWRIHLDQIEAKIAELGSQRCAFEVELEEVERDLADLRSLEAAKTTTEARAAAGLVVDVVHDGPQASTFDLRVDYAVPGAVWRPWHTARLVEEPGSEARVELRSDGCVWQSTGEDWTDVQLRFSTERPSLGVEPPKLSTDRLRARKRSTEVEVEARQDKVHTAGLGGDALTPTPSTDALPGIDDGGAVCLLQGRTRVTVVGDGKPHRVPLFEFSAPAQTSLLCVPELVASVMLRSIQTNCADKPLLAGPVDLVRRSGLVGRTSTLYVAPGERFELGWGPDSSLRVHRAVEFLKQERKTLSSWTHKPRKVTIKLSNLDATACTIEVKERIAVSEIEKVEVELLKASPPAAPDDDGFVSWNIRLGRLGHEEIRVAWDLVVHDDVVGL